MSRQIDKKQLETYRYIILREWYHCQDDKDYARCLYDLATGKPFEWFDKTTLKPGSRPYLFEVEDALRSTTDWLNKFSWKTRFRQLYTRLTSHQPCMRKLFHFQCHHNK